MKPATLTMKTTGATVETSTRVPLLRKQLAFIRAREKEVLYSGAFGAGKSRALCFKLALNATVPGTVHGLFRKTRTSLTRTTLRTLLCPEGTLPPVLPHGTYDHNKNEGTISLHGGGVILYAGCDQPDTVASMNLVSAAVDEVVDLDADEYTMILGRLRMAGGVRQLFGACNPGSPSHFLYDRFFKCSAELKKKRRLFQCAATENVFLPPDFIESLNELTGLHHARYVLGQWVAFEGLVYADLWQRATHLKHAPAGTVFREYVTGVDRGFTNPSVLVKYGVDGDGRMWQVGEFYRRNVLQADFVQAAVGMDEPGNIFIVDPSAADLIAAMGEAGLSVMAGDNEVSAGIAAVRDRLKVQADGLPRLLTAPDFEDTVREWEGYAWDKGKDKPLKELDHGMDATRYAVRYLDAGRISPSVSTAVGSAADMKRAQRDERNAAESVRSREEWEHEFIEGDEGWTT